MATNPSHCLSAVPAMALLQGPLDLNGGGDPGPAQPPIIRPCGGHLGTTGLHSGSCRGLSKESPQVGSL